MLARPLEPGGQSRGSVAKEQEEAERQRRRSWTCCWTPIKVGRSTAVFANGERVISGVADTAAEIYAVGLGQALKTLAGHARMIMSVAVFADGERAVTECADSTAKIWAVGSGQELKMLAGNEAMVMSAEVLADGEHVIIGSAENTAKI